MAKRMACCLKKPYNTDLYLRDGSKKIDAVLVYNRNQKDEKARENFLHNLKMNKLYLEYNTSGRGKTGDKEIDKDDTLIFIKVHAPKATLLRNAIKYNIPIKFKQKIKIPEPKVRFFFMKNLLNDPVPDLSNKICRRAWKTLSKQPPKDFTSSERSEIVFEMMENIRYGDYHLDVGLSQLLHRGVLNSAYPLHDGPWEWPSSEKEQINDRQLLAKYWANYKVWYKQQPLNVIEKYLGYEIALYFAWTGYYNKMLIIASVMGILTFIYGVLLVTVFEPNVLAEACESEILLCPTCKECQPELLKTNCRYYYYSYINDNSASIIFSCAMSFWATLFCEFWKREYAVLMTRWNIDSYVAEIRRPDFNAKAKRRRHPYTGEIELYKPLLTKFLNYSVSIGVVILMILVVLFVTVCIIWYEVYFEMMNYDKIFINVTSDIMTVIVTVILKKIYVCIAFRLTMYEVPRTQLNFDKSYMLKIILFAVVNNYGKMIYVAFFKGKFFTYPGDPNMQNSVFPIITHVCGTSGCVSELFILLATIAILTPIFDNLVEVVTPKFNIFINRLKYINIPPKKMELWEQEHDLNQIDRFSITSDLEELVLQYGYVTLLVPAFPLLPLAALLNNIFEIRIDASKIIKYHQRPQAKTISSINIWFDTVHAISVLAVITNGLFLAFTSNLIPKIVYYFHVDSSLKGFISFSLSKYRVEDSSYWTNAKNITECWYTGYRIPPESDYKYTLTYAYYYLLCFRLGFAIGYTIIVMLITGIISYVIPDIPQRLKDLVDYNRRKLKESQQF